MNCIGPPNTHTCEIDAASAYALSLTQDVQNDA